MGIEYSIGSRASRVNINTTGGLFNWNRAGKPVLYTSHACWPFIGPPRTLPDAHKEIGRDGLLCSGELNLNAIESTRLVLKLFNCPNARRGEVAEQCPSDFITSLDWQMIDENALKICLTQQNLHAQTLQADFALLFYFPYDFSEIQAPNLCGQRYYVGSNPHTPSHVYEKPTLVGSQTRDWSFRFDQPNAPFYLFHRKTKVHIETKGSMPFVNRYIVRTDPEQGRFLCVGPAIVGQVIENGATARLEALLSVKEK